MHSKFEVYGCAAKYIFLVKGREQKLDVHLILRIGLGLLG